MTSRDDDVESVVGTADALRARGEALRRFEQWESGRACDLTPAERISAIGVLYDLLPRSRRSRAFDPSGVAVMHKCLAVLAKPAA
jgi:hypothetical protein